MTKPVAPRERYVLFPVRVALFLCRFVLFPPLATVLSSPLGAAADVARVRADGNRWLRHLRLCGLTFDRLKSRNTCKLLFPWNKLAGGLPRFPLIMGVLIGLP